MKLTDRLRDFFIPRKMVRQELICGELPSSKEIYQTAFRSKQIGYGSAKSMIFVVILVAIAFAQIRLTSRKEVQL